MTRKTVFLAIILAMVACGCSKPNSDNPSGPNNPEEPDPISVKLNGTWRISNSRTEGLPDNIIFQDNSKGVVFDDSDIQQWFDLDLLEPVNFTYSIKDNSAITMKLMTGTNINAYFDTNFQGDPIINLSDGNLYYEKVSDSTDIPFTSEKDEPFVKVIKVTDCTANTITVQCQVINPRIFKVPNAQVGAYALVAGKTLNNSVPEIGKVNIEDVGTEPFECVIKGLNAGTSYEVYSYAVDSRNGMGNGSYGTSSISCTTK